ncbi:MAG: ABC transporter ATP-binding protein [Candidatus Moraniibacteriota bacterium]
MNKKIAIKVENISKTFRIPHEKTNSVLGAVQNTFREKACEEFKALNDVSFEVKKGEFFGIIGRNGSGKSTLLKILAGIYQTDKGKIRINGMISPFLELGIGFNPELSGRDNIYLNATVLGMTKKQIDKKFDSIVAFSELERFIDQKLKNYSSGMQVRLAFSVSIHANRDILLMDEVLAVGDSNFQSKCITEFNRYRNLGRTVIIVTHDISVVERYCDRAMLLRNGKIKKIGKASEIANAYVYDNMSDEEKRILKEEKEKALWAKKAMEKMKGKELENEKKRIAEEKKKQEEERKNKMVEITDVEFLDNNGKKKNVFETGESIDIKISFKIYKKIDGLNIGVGIYGSEKDERIFSYNTQMDNFKIKEDNNNLILHFNKLSILKGDYYLNAACFGKEEIVYYDIKQKYKKLKIFTPGLKGNYRGLCDFEHEWRNQSN